MTWPQVADHAVTVCEHLGEIVVAVVVMAIILAFFLKTMGK